MATLRVQAWVVCTSATVCLVKKPVHPQTFPNLLAMVIRMSGYSSELIQTRGPRRHAEHPHPLSLRKTLKGSRRQSRAQTRRFLEALRKFKVRCTQQSTLAEVQQRLHLCQHQQSSNNLRYNMHLGPFSNG
ncbi:hypothetical protein HPG69_012169 [Diceros bicornis minor]|uniref:Uncharacterized protein n=1 Tax=Diceros bicornis minor TaxID=77932 RepID=A0A7J7ELY4_DICBM|nr:hypothetical protein HPG69_012169 [Diceros bicornis minor]